MADITVSQIVDDVMQSTTAAEIATLILPAQAGNSGKYLTTDGTLASWGDVSSGSGTVTTVSVTTANGVSGTVANATTTPAITLSLGAITPSTVNGITLNGASGSGINLSASGTLTIGSNAVEFSSTALTVDGAAYELPGISGVLALGTTQAIRFGGATAARTYTMPDANATIVGTTATQALTNKTYNGLTVTTSTGTLTITNAKTLSVSNSLTLSGTDGTTMTFPSTSASIARIDAAQSIAGVQTFTDTTASTSSTTGAAKFAGGVGVVGFVMAGGFGFGSSATSANALFVASAATNVRSASMDWSFNGNALTLPSGAPTIEFGGATSSFPEIARSTTSLIVRLADGTSGGNLEVTGSTTLGTGGTSIARSKVFSASLGGAISAGDSGSYSVSASGVQTGDTVAFSLPQQTAGLALEAVATATDAVVFYFRNTTGSEITLSGTAYVRTFEAA